MKAAPFLLLLPLTLTVMVPRMEAQTTGPTAEQLKEWVAVRKQRVDLLRTEIKQADARIESRLDLIVETLTNISDSKDSRTKVARMKEETMKRLAKTVQYYDQKRAALREDLRKPQTKLTEAEKRQIIAVFDERIARRTQQILALNKSMPAHEDYERYTATGGGWYGTDFQRNQDYEQNRRITSHSNTQRDALVKQLDASIARLERMGQTLRTQLTATSDPAQQKQRTDEIAKNDALIAERRQQRVEVLQGGGGAQRGVPLKEAMDLDQTLKKATDELRRDFNTLFQRYNTLLGELGALHATEALLAQQQK